MTDDELSVGADESREQRKRKKNKAIPFGCSSKITAAVILCILLCTAVYFVAKWDSLSPDSLESKASFFDSKKDEAYTDITGSTVFEKNFEAIESGLMYISDTSITQLNHDCERVYSEKHSFSDPFIRSSNKYSIAFGEGSGSFRIIYDKHKIYEGVEGNSITDCDINDMGVYGIISDRTGYLSCLYVYDKNNKLIYSYSFSDVYAVSVSLSSDGKKAVVGSVNSLEGRLVSKIYLLDFEKSEPINTFTYQDQLVYEVKFVSDESVAVITDMFTSVIRSDGTHETPYSYASQILTAYDICYDNRIVLSLSQSSDGRSCSIVTLEPDGNETGSFHTDLKVVAVDAAADRTAVLSYGLLSVYTSAGDLLTSHQVGTDAKNVLLPQNKTAYILGVSGITKIKLDQ